MSGKILVAYATRAGSTGEVAQAIAETLRQEGLDVDLLRARKVADDWEAIRAWAREVAGALRDRMAEEE